MSKIFESQIMEHKWHEFLYGSKTEERDKFLKCLIDDFPVIYDGDSPMGIYLDSCGILEHNKKEVSVDDQVRLDVTAREYLKNCIAFGIISRIESNSQVMGNVEEELLKFLNSEYFGRQDNLISVRDYLKELRETISICRDTYDSVLNTGDMLPKMFDFPSDFYDIEKFGKRVKKILNNNDQFNIIVNHKDKLTLESYKAIMTIINSRCAGTICMKVATDPNEWNVFCDLNGRLVESVHDYSYVELDDSYNIKLNKIKRQY